MCGIAGIAYKDLDPQIARSGVRNMIGILQHRGPDGMGFYDEEGISLGHARLAIIDLSEMGSQPMSDSTGRYWITYNGEIYNYPELAGRLRQEGVHFRGSSDTEVLLASYIQWGNQCVTYLRGMFAFAIWDNEKQQLFCARDRLGIKPFHYWCDRNGGLFFASEMKALLPFISDPKIHTILAREYIAWNLLDHDTSQTMFENVKRLPPGSMMVWDSEKGEQITQYWSLGRHNQYERIIGSNGQLFQEFRERFEHVIHLHLRSDVPVGTSLSGGLDSSAIVGMVNLQLRNRGIWRDGWQHVFSACFEESELDERPYIQEMVSATGVEPHYVFPTGEQLLTDLEIWLWHQEEPVGGTGTFAQFCVARLARQYGIKVLLDGQGADEILAGYRKFIIVFLKELLQEKNYYKAIRESVSFFLNPEILRTSRLMDGRRYLFETPVNSKILWPQGDYPMRPSSLGFGESLVARLNGDVTRFSLPLLLRYEDRNSMAFGVEARVPFVDHEFVEWMMMLPSHMRLYKGWTKRILRESLVGILPEKIRRRKTKLGFLTPEEKWLTGPLKPWLLSTLRGSQFLDEIVNLGGVHKLLERFKLGFHSSSILNTLFRLAIFETWARLFLR